MIDQYLTPGWIMLAISLIGFISFYLGKIVLDFYPSNEDKALNYIVGFILFLIYILIPSLAFYYFQDYLLWNLNFLGFLGLLIIYGFFAKYFRIKMNLFQIKRGKADKYFQKVFSKNISKFSIKLNKVPRIKKIFTELPSQIKVIFLGYLTILIIINMIFYFNNLIIQAIIIIATISTFNNIIVLHNAKKIKFKEVIITDIKNKKFKGKLIKRDSNYIVLNNEKELYVFSRESVKNIREIRKFDLKRIEKKIDNVSNAYNKLKQQLKTKKPNK